jgi:hypothetical protein
LSPLNVSTRGKSAVLRGESVGLGAREITTGAGAGSGIGDGVAGQAGNWQPIDGSRATNVPSGHILVSAGQEGVGFGVGDGVGGQAEN